MSAHLKRRQFITLVGGAAVAWPLAARAQRAQRRIGVLMMYAESDPQAQIRIKALEEVLQMLGWTKGGTLRIDYCWVGADSGRFQQHAADLVRSKEEVIVAVSSPAVRALQRESHDIPIVFTQVSDPVGQGIVKNMALPGGDITGFTTTIQKSAANGSNYSKKRHPTSREQPLSLIPGPRPTRHCTCVPSKRLPRRSP